MKHSLPITLLILGIFLLAQFIGIFILYKYIDPEQSAQEGKTVFKELPIGERPPVEEKTSFIPVILAVLIGTVILLILIKYKLAFIWKLWFLMAAVITLTVAFTAFISTAIAFGLALVLGIWKVLKPNVIVHNCTELFIYGGLAAIFVPLFNLFSVIILLILISGYDAYAVCKSKHMITLAKSQAESKIFAGLLIPYKLGKAVHRKVRSASTKVIVKSRTAMLGGGDIGFPLIFAGVVLKEMGLWQSLVIPFFALLGLGWLLFIADEEKFYPAMPFISVGCFVGLAVVWVVGALV